jgi:hypothetical protein
VKGAFELKDVHCDVRIYFPTSHFTENLQNLINSSVCHFTSSAPISPPISRHILYINIHIEFKIKLRSVQILFKTSNVIKDVACVNGTKFCCCLQQCV